MFKIVVNNETTLRKEFKTFAEAEAWTGIIWSAGAVQIDIVFDTGLTIRPIVSYEME